MLSLAQAAFPGSRLRVAGKAGGGCGAGGGGPRRAPGNPPGQQPPRSVGQGEQRGLRRGDRLQHRSGRYGRGGICGAVILSVAVKLALSPFQEKNQEECPKDCEGKFFLSALISDRPEINPLLLLPSPLRTSER